MDVFQYFSSFAICSSVCMRFSGCLAICLDMYKYRMIQFHAGVCVCTQICNNFRPCFAVYWIYLSKMPNSHVLVWSCTHAYIYIHMHTHGSMHSIDFMLKTMGRPPPSVFSSFKFWQFGPLLWTCMIRWFLLLWGMLNLFSSILKSELLMTYGIPSDTFEWPLNINSTRCKTAKPHKFH